jgi:hypothetical protein
MMTPDVQAAATAMQLLDLPGGLAMHQGLYAAASLGLADLLRDSPRTAADLAQHLEVNESILYRVLRVLASHGVFEEIEPHTFANTRLSQFLCTNVPGSIRALLTFRGSEFYFAPFGDILHSIRTGEPARSRVGVRNGFESLRHDPEQARLFDDAMTNMSQLVAPAIASAYDFGQWGSIADVGGGSGVLLASMLRAYPRLRGVLADQPHVLHRARDRGFLAGDHAVRATMQECDFLRGVPPGCRAYLLKNILANWDDEQARTILRNCLQVVPDGGALILVDFCIPEGNLPSRAKIVDLTMLVLYGGKVRSLKEYEELLGSAGFDLSRVVQVPGELSIMEALPTSSARNGRPR